MVSASATPKAATPKSATPKSKPQTVFLCGACNEHFPTKKFYPSIVNIVFSLDLIYIFGVI